MHGSQGDIKIDAAKKYYSRVLPMHTLSRLHVSQSSVAICGGVILKLLPVWKIPGDASIQKSML